MNKHKVEHGTKRSYLVGFILSFVFTIIPYLLVDNKVVTGTALLATIMGFAVLQMAIQIFFFLHLGRGPKPLYNVVFFVSTAGIILVVVVGSIFIMDNLHYNMAPAEVTKKLAQDEAIAQISGAKTGACRTNLNNHAVTIYKGHASPPTFTAQLCDTLTFINEDDTEHIMAFGSHPHHDSYAGNEEISVRKGHNETITLNQAGTFKFHDHLKPEIGGEFTVTE